MSKRAGLSGRLSRLKKDGMTPPGKKRDVKSLNQSYGLESLEGWEKIHTDVWKKTTILQNPMDSQYSNSLQIPSDCEISDFIFYDTETTGLSTGAGTIPFLVGLGYVRGG
jgi:uncharacterized protein YprB with RNaseH-like and TPR domain